MTQKGQIPKSSGTYGEASLYPEIQFDKTLFNPTAEFKLRAWDIHEFLPKVKNVVPMPNSCLSYVLNILLGTFRFRNTTDIYKCVTGKPLS